MELQTGGGGDVPEPASPHTPLSPADMLRTSSGSEQAQNLTCGDALGLVWPMVLVAVLEQACASTRDTIYFPFLRTIISCPLNATAVVADRHSREWSGSLHCHDRCYVAEQAQLLRGISNSAEQTVQRIPKRHPNPKPQPQ